MTPAEVRMALLSAALIVFGGAVIATTKAITAGRRP